MTSDSKPDYVIASDVKPTAAAPKPQAPLTRAQMLQRKAERDEAAALERVKWTQKFPVPAWAEALEAWRGEGADVSDNPPDNADDLCGLIHVLLPTGYGEPQEVFNIVNNELERQGKKPWKATTFNRWWDEQERVEEELQETRELKKKRAWLNIERQIKSGRPPTLRTERVERIALVLGVARRRAYTIDEEGTGSFDQRVKLARAFSNDPERNHPDAWDLEDGRKWGRTSSSRKSFRDFILSPAADEMFDAHVLTLQEEYQKGMLPDHVEDLRELIKLGASVDVPAEEMVRIWDLYLTWRANFQLVSSQD